MDANVLYQHVQLDIDLMQAREAMDRKIAQEREEEDRTLWQEHDDMALTQDARALLCGVDEEVQLSSVGLQRRLGPSGAGVWVRSTLSRLQGSRPAGRIGRAEHAAEGLRGLRLVLEDHNLNY